MMLELSSCKQANSKRSVAGSGASGHVLLIASVTSGWGRIFNHGRAEKIKEVGPAD